MPGQKSVDAFQIFFTDIRGTAQPAPLTVKFRHDHNTDDWAEVQNARRCPGALHAARVLFTGQAPWEM